MPGYISNQFNRLSKIHWTVEFDRYKASFESARTTAVDLYQTATLQAEAIATDAANKKPLGEKIEDLEERITALE